MNKETQDRIFKPFEQADGSTTRQYGGTGLGLSITQNLVELMKGKIELRSTHKQGSVFTITLPLKRVREHSKLDDLDSQEHTQVHKNLDAHILVAEDNKTNQLLIQMLLEELGISCDIANDGNEALEMYNPSVHRLILMDENMPNLNGIKAMQEIREKHKENTGPIIALTANAMRGDKERFLNLGMDGYIAKPIDEEILYKTLRKALQKKN